MKKLLLVLMALMMAGCVSTKRYKQLDTRAGKHIMLRNQIITELIDAGDEEQKQEIIKRFGIKVIRPKEEIK